jgi:hypothetical protein
MLPDEPLLSELALRKKLGKLRGGVVMHCTTLHRAIVKADLPSHPNPFGRGLIFYWSEIQEWLRGAQPSGQEATPVTPLPRRPGRPRKAACQ